jgi:8-oxo-dGTP diphosphatase
MKCTVYQSGELKNYKYAVIFARYKGKWVICKHKNRNTWETAGGHIEKGESPMEAAKRELYEETGSVDYEIQPVCDYWVCDEPHEVEHVTWSNSQAFLANVNKIGELPESEMEKIDLVEYFPRDLTYPEITYKLLPHIVKKVPWEDKRELNKQLVNCVKELKISDMLKCQYDLWEKHKDKWPPMEPEAARDSLLWMIEEIGEVIAIIKKRGEKEITQDGGLKDEFVEELVDVFMYYLDVLNRYNISGDVFSNAYIKKHTYNLLRDFEREHNNYKKQI